MARFPSVLETERLIVRASHPDAAAAVNAAIRDSIAELQLWMPWADHVPALDETLAHLRQAQERYQGDLDCSLTLWDRASGVLVGGSGLHPRSADPRQREIGYWIRSSHTRRGYATEAVRAIAEAGLPALDLTAIQLRASERNIASQRVAERAGFAREAVVDDGRIDPGGFPSRTVLYVLTRRVA